MTRLEEIRNDLDKYIKSELEKSLGDRDFEVFSFEEKLYEIIDSLDEIIHFNPTLMTLEEIHTALEKLIKNEEKIKNRYLPDAEYNVPTWDNIYDALEAIESIIEFDPTPQYLYDDTGGEPPISAEERSRKAFEQKLIDKG